jgi:hypothetical protein
LIKTTWGSFLVVERLEGEVVAIVDLDINVGQRCFGSRLSTH